MSLVSLYTSWKHHKIEIFGCLQGVQKVISSINLVLRQSKDHAHSTKIRSQIDNLNLGPGEIKQNWGPGLVLIFRPEPMKQYVGERLKRKNQIT